MSGDIIWRPLEALFYVAKDWHERAYWADANQTHAREFSECTDEICVAVGDDMWMLEVEQESIGVHDN